MTEIKQPNMQKATSSDYWSLASNQYPSGKFPKVSIGIPHPRSGSVSRGRDAADAAPAFERNLSQRTDGRSRPPKANNASLRVSQEAANHGGSATEAPEAAHVRVSLSQPDDQACEQTGTFSFGTRKEQGSQLDQLQKTSFVNSQGKPQVESADKTKPNSEVLRMKLWGILGTSQTKQAVASQNPEDIETPDQPKSLTTNGPSSGIKKVYTSRFPDIIKTPDLLNCQTATYAKSKPSSDPIESDSDTPQVVEIRPVTRTLGRKKAPAASQKQDKSQSAKKPLSTSRSAPKQKTLDSVFVFGEKCTPKTMGKSAIGNSGCPPPPPPPPLARSGTRRPPARPAVALISTPTSSLRTLCRTPARAGVGSDENARPGGASTRAPAEPGAAYRPPLRAIQQIQPTRRAAGKTPARVGAVTTPLRPTNTPAPGKPKPVLRLRFSTTGATGAQLQRPKVPGSILLWEENHTVQQNDSDALAKEGNSSEHKLSLQLELDITKTILLEEVKGRVEAEARAAALGDELKRANICTLEACRQKEATKKELEVTISVLDLVEAKQVCLIKQIEELKKKRDQETLMLNTELQQEGQAMGEAAEAITSLINQLDACNEKELLADKQSLVLLDRSIEILVQKEMEEISEERKTYAEAKDKAIKLLEMSLEDADVTVCALEEKVKLLEEEAVDLQHARQQLLVVPSCREAKSSMEKRMVDSPNPIRHLSNINYGVLHSEESRTGKEEACEVEGEGIKGPTTRIKRSARQLLLSFLKTASEEELQTLKGIREKRAKRILELREQSPEVFASLKDVFDSIEMRKPQVSNMMWDMMVGP